MRRFRNLIVLAFVVATSSCYDTKQLTYFNDVRESAEDTISNRLYRNNESVIQPNDILSINVTSLSPEASKVFNAPNESTMPGASSVNTLTAGYLVSQSGEIQFPMLGTIRAAGLTKSELTNIITGSIKEKKLLIDPIVTIRYLNFRISILGEVTNPGVFTVPVEKITLIEALGLAGDLTMYGKRDNVLLIRENGDNQKIYKRINLNSAEILTSPYYYLRSNDVLYIEPSRDKVAIEKTSMALPIIFSLISLVIVAIGTFGN